MSTIRNIFVTKDLRVKIAFVLFMLLLYKVGTHIPVPGVQTDLLKGVGSDGGILGFANTLTGGAIMNFSIFAVGIMPYITASIAIQLLAMDVVPKLTEMKKRGEQGQKQMKVITRYVTVFLAFFQSLGMSFGFNQMYPGLVENDTILGYIWIALFLTLGTIALMFMGERIDKKGIGNGISLIILAGIVITLPQGMAQYYAVEFTSVGDGLPVAIIKTAILVVFLLAVMAVVVLIHKAERRIPIHYANQGSSGKAGNFKESFLPIKVNASGVIPVIFASALFMMPVTLVQFFEGNAITDIIITYFGFQHPIGLTLYIFTIIFFSYFYAFIQLSPEKTAADLQSGGGFVPGIRPGKTTEKYIHDVLSRLTFVGAIFLAILSALPFILSNITQLPTQVQVGGVSLIIVVSVALDTLAKINAQLLERKYKGFLK